MVQRASQAPEFGSSTARVQLQGTQVGNVRLDQSLAQAVPSGLDTALAALVPSLSRVADTAMQTSMEEAYLQGVSAAATKQTEEQLELNPITADWQRAGFRDTMGKLAYAEQGARLITDMPELRQLSPAEFQDELGRRRAEMLPQLEGMSRRQREVMLEQLATSEVRAVQQHATEHQKWMVDADIGGIRAQIKTNVLALNAARASGDATAYAAALAEMQFSLVDLGSNPRIPGDAKGKAVREIAEYALESDHLPVYDLVTAGSWGDSTNPVFQHLSPDDGIALSKAARASEQRTEAVRSIAWQDQDAVMSAGVDTGQLPDPKQYEAHLQEGVRLKFISGDAYRARKEALYKKQLEGEQSLSAAKAFGVGDIDGLRRMGVSEEDAAKMWEKLTQDKPLEQVVAGLIGVGQKGIKQGFKRAAELSAGAWAELQFSPDKMLPANEKVLTTTIQMLDALEAQGKQSAMVGYLGGLDEGTRSFIEQYRVHLKAGNSMQVSASKASEALKLHAGKTPQQRASMVAADEKWEDFLNSKQRLFNAPGQAWAYLKEYMPFTGKGHIAERSLGITRDLFENESASRAALYPIFQAVMEEARAEVVRNPGNAGEPAWRIGIAAVAGNRLIPTSQMPILVSQGFSIAGTYGERGKTPPTAEAVGQAIDRLGQPPNGFRRVYEQDRFGNLTYSDWDKKTGQRTTTKAIIPVAAIKQSLLEMDREKVAIGTYTYGEGKQVTGGGMKFRYNGDNTAGVDNFVAFKLRDSLLRFEGVTSIVKPDVNKKAVDTAGRPVVTGGVGISSTNTHFPKGLQAGSTMTADQVRDSFLKASDDALRQGRAAAVVLGVYNEAGIIFASHLAYQAGDWTNPKHKDNAAYSQLKKAIMRRDSAAAVKAFESTTAAKYGEGRREWYKSQIRKMLG